MNNEEIREHQIKRLNKYSQPFQRLFGCEITEYYTRPPELYVFDIFKFFADLHIPPETNMRDYICQEYGPEALALIDKLF